MVNAAHGNNQVRNAEVIISVVQPAWMLERILNQHPVRKGQKSEQTVHTPLPAPIVHAVTIQKPSLEDAGVINVNFGSLRKDLRTSLKNDDCSGLEENGHDEGKIFFTKITEKKCWLQQNAGEAPTTQDMATG